MQHYQHVHVLTPQPLPYKPYKPTIPYKHQWPETKKAVIGSARWSMELGDRKGILGRPTPTLSCHFSADCLGVSINARACYVFLLLAYTHMVKCYTESGVKREMGASNSFGGAGIFMFHGEKDADGARHADQVGIVSCACTRVCRFTCRKHRAAVQQL